MKPTFADLPQTVYVWFTTVNGRPTSYKAYPELGMAHEDRDLYERCSLYDPKIMRNFVKQMTPNHLKNAATINDAVVWWHLGKDERGVPQAVRLR